MRVKEEIEEYNRVKRGVGEDERRNKGGRKKEYKGG